MNQNSLIKAGITAFIGFLALIILVGRYNTLANMQEDAKGTWANVEAQYQRRMDLIPNIVEVFKAYTKHEKEITEIEALRIQWANAQKSGNINGAYQAAVGMDNAISRLMAVVGNNSQLKANENFMRLQDELAGTENRIWVARKKYNKFATNYNKALRGSIFKGFAGLEPMPLFKADAGAEKAPVVKF